MIRQIKFVSVPVKDQDVALKFWIEKMGLKVATDQPFDGKQRWIELMIPGAETGLVLFTPEGHETLEQLREEGIALLTKWLAMLSPEQRAALAAALPALEALAEPEAPVQRSR